VSGPPKPLFEVGFSSFFREVIPKPLEFFFKVVGPEDRKIKFEQMREPSVFLGGEIPGAFEQDEASFFQIDHLLMSQPSYLLPSDLIEGLIQMLDDMEAIKNQCGLRGMALNRCQIRSPHIQTDGLKGSSFPFSQPSKEFIEGLLFSVQPHPEKSSSFPIIDQGEITMSLLARNFINAEQMKGLDLS